MPKSKQKKSQTPVIAISYRDEGLGKGAFYDHLTLRALTRWQTEIVHEHAVAITNFANLINYRAGYNQYGLPLDQNIPARSDNDGENAAFLFIPGYTRDSDSKQAPSHLTRMRYEQSLINKARHRGQPVLAVCAGSWTLWQTFSGKLKQVDDHNYGGAMPRLSKAQPEICNNKMIHRINISPHTFLDNSMGLPSSRNLKPKVNSVHWRACDDNEQDMPKELMISAHAVPDNRLAPKNRQSKLMQPDACVEGFETKHGAPIMGVQWHPEAFNLHENAQQNKLFQFMKSAGQTYLNRKNLNQEFCKKHSELSTSGLAFFGRENSKQTKELHQAKANDTYELK